MVSVLYLQFWGQVQVLRGPGFKPRQGWNTFFTFILAPFRIFAELYPWPMARSLPIAHLSQIAHLWPTHYIANNCTGHKILTMSKLCPESIHLINYLL